MLKKRITTEEYNTLSIEEKKKFKEMHFDENFNPGCGDDIDYSYRVLKAELKIYVADFWVDHHRMSAHTISKADDPIAAEKLKEEHAKYFRKKHNIGYIHG